MPIDHAISWHVYPLGFTGAPVRPRDGQETGPWAPGGGPPSPGWPEGQASGQNRIRRLEAWLDYALDLGVNELSLGPVFASRSHGYDTLDHFRIDSRLGEDADLDALIAEAGRRGVGIVLDGVFNHVSGEHPLVREALERGPGSEAASMFRIDWDAPGGPRLRCFEGHGDLVEFDHASPHVVSLVQAVMRHWLARGIRGWRLDAAYATGPGFWQQVLPDVRRDFPDAFVFAEMIHGDYVSFVDRSGVDSVTQYELWKAIWSAISSANFFELSWALERHDAFLDRFVPVTFVGNHDVTRIAEQVGDDGAVLALVILLTVGGRPSLYYGDEQALHGLKEERRGGDDAIRPAFPTGRQELGPDGWWMYRLHQQLIGMRRRHAWLGRARTTVKTLTNERFVYVTRDSEGPQRLTVELDLRGRRPAAVVRGDSGVEFSYPA